MKLRHIDVTKLVEPRTVRIGSSEKRLYTLEERRNKVIQDCAGEWASIVHRAFGERVDHWKQAVPQALFDTLCSFQTDCAVVACLAFLKKEGVIMTWEGQEKMRHHGNFK